MLALILLLVLDTLLGLHEGELLFHLGSLLGDGLQLCLRSIELQKTLLFVDRHLDFLKLIRV